MSKDKRHTLQQVASLVFALTAVLPLLMFTYTLIRLNGLRGLEDQITLGLTLLAAGAGFRILRVMVTRVSDLLGAVGKTMEPGEGEAPPVASNGALQVPGVGAIHEFHEIADMLWPAWKAEAEPHLGQRVLISVKNSSHPIAGTVVEVTDDGVLLEENGQPLGVSYRRVSAIEAVGSRVARPTRQFKRQRPAAELSVRTIGNSARS